LPVDHYYLIDFQALLDHGLAVLRTRGYDGSRFNRTIRFHDIYEGAILAIRYRFDTSIGTFSPSLSATGYYKYQSATFAVLVL